MRKHRKYCMHCDLKNNCYKEKKPDKCPIGNFDEYDK